MSTNYRAIFVDIDRTLTGPDLEVSRANRDAVRAARDAGLAVVVCTGRCYRQAERVAKELDLGDASPMICAGGALVSRIGDGATVRRWPMAAALCDRVVATALEMRSPPLLLQDGTASGYDFLHVLPAGLDNRYVQWRKQTVCDVRQADRWSPGPADCVLRVSMVENDAASADALRRRLAERLDGQAHWHDLYYPDDDLRLLEVFAAGVNKGSAMRWLCEANGWPIGWTAAIGDDVNDVPMMAAGGLGIAMGNGHADVRAAAAVVTAGHDADGAGQAIGRLLAGEFDGLARVD